MKLQELAASPTKQAAKVFESYFGGRIRLDTISRRQTRDLLGRVRGLVKEHRKTPEFHRMCTVARLPLHRKTLRNRRISAYLHRRLYQDGGISELLADGSAWLALECIFRQTGDHQRFRAKLGSHRTVGYPSVRAGTGHPNGFVD